MPVIYKACPLCNSENISAYLKATDHLLTHEIFDIFRCGNCGFVFTQGVPLPDQIGKYYQSQDYISHSDTRKGLMNKLYHFGRTYMLGVKYRMVKKFSEGNKLLDIGCGTGYFPAYMERKGYQAEGVEADPEARAFAERESGITVYSPEEFINPGLNGRFDVITLWHVLEHLDDFDLYLDKILEHLLPGGTLVVALPNCDSLDARHFLEFWAGYDVPRHLWHFTPSTFKMLAEKHGLEILKMKRLILDPFYNSMLSGKYKGHKLYMVTGIVTGKLAYIESLFAIKRSSSIVYFLKVKKN